MKSIRKWNKKIGNAIFLFEVLNLSPSSILTKKQKNARFFAFMS